MKPKIFIARGISSKELLDSVFDRYNIKDRTLKYGEYGKPYLASGDLFFNLSHCGDMVVCAVCDREVGVDIQRIDYRKNVINKVCGREEAAEIRTPGPTVRRSRMRSIRHSTTSLQSRSSSFSRLSTA